MYLADGDRYVIVASKGGAPTNPDWYYNVSANPDVTLEVGTETFDATATIAQEPERTELYSKMEAKAPGFTEYKNNTDRTIPVIILTRK
jgi:deazaflavin-dependent oxidoreductase (nitroreductase family)